MKHLILSASVIAVSTFTLAACENASDHAETDHTNADHSAASHNTETGIEVSDAFIRPPLPGRDVAAAYFDLSNSGEADRLISAESNISENVEIHTHTMEDGVMKMRRIDGVDLPAGETVSFEPGSYHLMMFGANIPEGVEDVSVTLKYESAEPMMLTVPLGEPSEEMDMKDGMDHGSGH
ncbi:copper chaperone PCu(A)C [Litorimonas haliclonae]|uniref:copper chaperone PCu(A)C n=1 Tax=Litorimonas haliclonae TaxID=2081977 RepID=UPI0039EE659F